MMSNVSVAAHKLNIRLVPQDVSEPGQFEDAFAGMLRQHVGDPMLGSYRTRIAELAMKSRLPSMHTNRPHVEAGGLMSYGPSFTDLWRRAAVYVDKILRGTQPADLPVEQPTKFELVINLKTAKALGLTIPPKLLTRADEVIE